MSSSASGVTRLPNPPRLAKPKRHGGARTNGIIDAKLSPIKLAGCDSLVALLADPKIHPPAVDESGFREFSVHLLLPPRHQPAGRVVVRGSALVAKEKPRWGLRGALSCARARGRLLASSMQRCDSAFRTSGENSPSCPRTLRGPLDL